MTALNGIHPASPAAPAAARGRYLHEVLRILAGVALLTVSARIALPAQPVPITAQTLAVMLLGALLGPQRGTLSVLTYLAVGAAGVPVFAGGGGLPYMLGPTGGYLIGFVPAAWLAGAIIGRSRTFSPVATALAFTLSTAVIFAFGLAWLRTYVPSPRELLTVGLVPFLPGAAVKITVACLVVARMRR